MNNCYAKSIRKERSLHRENLWAKKIIKKEKFCHFSKFVIQTISSIWCKLSKFEFVHHEAETKLTDQFSMSHSMQQYIYSGLFLLKQNLNEPISAQACQLFSCLCNRLMPMFQVPHVYPCKMCLSMCDCSNQIFIQDGSYWSSTYFS